MSHTAPKFLTIREVLHERVRTMHAGEPLPTEANLRREFGVSRSTLRHAIDGLVDLGMVAREQGRGMFVASPTPRLYFPEHFTDEITGFHDQQTLAGNSVTSVILRRGRRPAWGELANTLKIAEADEVYELTRLRHVNGVLHHYAAAYVPAGTPGAAALDEFEDGSLLSYIENAGGVPVGHVDVSVTLDMAEVRVADALGLEHGTPALTAMSNFVSIEGQPLVTSFATFTPNSSRLTFTIGLEASRNQ